MWRELAGDPLLREVEDDLLGPVDELLGGQALALEAEPGDLAARRGRGRGASPSRGRCARSGRRSTTPGRARRARGSRTGRRLLELAAPLELVDERDRVDRLALRVEVERRPVDLRVALAVEVARREDFADRPDRAGGEHHRAEDRLLGIEILRRDRGGRRSLGKLGHAGQINHLRTRPERAWTTALSTRADWRVCRQNGTHVPSPAGRSGGRKGRS